MKNMVFSGPYGEVMYGEDCWLTHANCKLCKINFIAFIASYWLGDTYSISIETVTGKSPSDFPKLCFALNWWSYFSVFHVYSCLIQNVWVVSAHSAREIVDLSKLQLSTLQHFADWRLNFQHYLFHFPFFVLYSL